MHERNDEALNRAAHGRASFRGHDSAQGMEQYVTEMSTPLGRVSLIFESERRVKVSVCHAERFFRCLEKAWNELPDFGESDIHAKFHRLAADGDSRALGLEQRRLVVGEFLHKAASALDALALGQRAEIASLEEHARQLHLATNSPRSTQGKEAL